MCGQGVNGCGTVDPNGYNVIQWVHNSGWDAG